MRTRVLEEYGGMQQTRGRRAQGSGLVGGIASVATRASRARPRAGSRSARIGNDARSNEFVIHGFYGRIVLFQYIFF